MTRPTALSLFCGAGGMCLGFEQAGFDIPLAVDIDPVHTATHGINFPMWKTLTQPVELLTCSAVRELFHGTPDVIVGGPPCQGFSLSGKRKQDDSRSSLIREFIRLIAQLRPKYFLLENVEGLTMGRCRQVLDWAIARFRDLKYHFSEWKILNAKDYGVPQSRRRLFVLGSRDDVKPACYPTPTSTEPVTVVDALHDIPNVDDDYWYIGNGKLRYYDSDGIFSAASRYAQEMRARFLKPEKFLHDGYPRAASDVLYNSNRTKHSEAVRSRFANTRPGTREPISHFDRLDPNGIAPTLRAGTPSGKGRHTAPRHIHYRYARCITVREMARLSGFPDWFRFHESTWHGARQIGNAVPPPLARALALEIIKVLRSSS